ncbi:MAG: alpha-1,4-glucan--maltose-1-phosphate maltosyltransferase, partial [bacterium]
FEYWIEQGVKIFRVDNPHTKPFVFWEWLIGELKSRYPEVILLSEAFTRPKVMHQLAKLGFTQSYTYFTWRNSKWEIEEYLQELCHHPSREYFIPNLWPNTPDILHAYLQTGGRPAFIVRFILAATAGSNYGIYGPAFELCVNTPLKPGSEEYLNSEKYEIKYWDLNAPHSLKPLISLVNRIRKENPALHKMDNLRIYRIDNPLMVVYGKRTGGGDSGTDRRHFGENIVIVALNLDPHYTQSGWVEIPVEDIGVSPDQTYWVHDLLTGNRYPWKGSHNYIELNPHHLPAHIFRVEKE